MRLYLLLIKLCLFSLIKIYILKDRVTLGKKVMNLFSKGKFFIDIMYNTVMVN